MIAIRCDEHANVTRDKVEIQGMLHKLERRYEAMLVVAWLATRWENGLDEG